MPRAPKSFRMTPSAGTTGPARQRCVLVFLPEPRAGPDLSHSIGLSRKRDQRRRNGVYFVGNRGIWYPHLEGMAQFAPV